ncbi:MAG: AMP-binding protein, partial [Pseudomonadota bacterium]
MYLTQGLHRAAKLRQSDTALISPNRSFTWAEMRDRVARLAGALHRLGLQTEDRIAMLSLNSDRYAEYYYATFWAGGLVVPMNIRWSQAEHVYSLNDSSARFLVVDDQFAEMGAAVAQECKSVEFVIFAGDGETPAGMLNYEALIAEAEAIPDTFRKGEDLAGIFYTGGTTGFPKGVMLPQRALWASAVAFGNTISISPKDRTLHAAPMFHIAGNATLFSITTFGGSHAFMPGFEAGAFLRAVEAFKPTVTLLVPTMIGMLMEHPDTEATDTSSLTRMIYGASPISENVLKEAMRKLPETGFVHAYGQTEMSPLITLMGPEYHVLEGPMAGKIRSVGQTVFTVEAEVVDEDGQELPRGDVGELRTRGAQTMLGYWNKPEQTADTLRDGWVHTGDGAYMDDE